MPGGDRTGPGGTGPRTGRAAGFCTGNRMPGYANPVGQGFGRGGGFGFGGGGFGRGRRNSYLSWGTRARGFRGWFSPFCSDNQNYELSNIHDDERKFLMAEAHSLRSALDDINKRLDEIQKSTKDD